MAGQLSEIISQSGRGTQVAGAIPQSKARAQETIRRASLVHRSEAFLLEALTTGYNLAEIQEALDLAMDRWKTLAETPANLVQETIRFAGSHDLVINGLARHFFGEYIQNARLQVTFSGSLGGLVSLTDGKSELCGCRLWDEASGEYNFPFIQKRMPGVDVTVVTLAIRRLGLIFGPGIPFQITSLADLPA